MVIEVRRVSEWVSECVLICVWVCSPMDWSLPGTSVHGILQARLLQWVAMRYLRGSSRPRNQIHISSVSCTGKWILYHFATGKPWGQKEAGLMRKTLETVRMLEQEPRGAWTGLWPLFLKCPKGTRTSQCGPSAGTSHCVPGMDPALTMTSWQVACCALGTTSVHATFTQDLPLSFVKHLSNV